MRPLALMLLFAAPAACFAAPVPKELRRGPAIVGTWEMTAMDQGIERADNSGGRWIFAPGGTFTTPSYPSGTFVERADGTDIRFAANQNPWLALIECRGDTLKIAFPKNPAVRAADFVGANNNVVYSFRRVKE